VNYATRLLTQFFAAKLGDASAQVIHSFSPVATPPPTRDFSGNPVKTGSSEAGSAIAPLFVPREPFLS
jgi:hypothetical protein